ncbi:hypothetical protein [Oscillatoria acuminata]|uniref:Uncharacterized protein n=1 Tax=Oscillatoria acuminata PCC 6304 TaxID=56110 RepID=K9TLX8_9CYAN|nr:hypothetical protein [Oscillatoria acuminata]AFY83540.1 hypothetical protein Oscil6304_4002 [Oscillatoria acuminata PCC 6304]
MIFDDFLSLEDVKTYNTEQILQKLNELGITLTKEEFLQQIQSCYGVSELKQKWKSLYEISAQGRDKDFVSLGALVLWERLAPNYFSSDQLYVAIEEGLDDLEAGERRKICELWLECWEKLKERFIPMGLSFADLDKKLDGCLYRVSEWLLEIPTELDKLGKEDPIYFQKEIDYCRDFLGTFPDADDRAIIQLTMLEAMTLFSLEKVEEGDNCFENLVKRYPGKDFLYITWGGLHWKTDFCPPSRVDLDKAEQIYRMGLTNLGDDYKMLLPDLKAVDKERLKAKKKSRSETKQKGKGKKSTRK